MAKAKTSGAKVLFGPYAGKDRNTAMLEFPGGYIAEIHSAAEQKEATRSH
jgi:hypothetical protein